MSGAVVDLFNAGGFDLKTKDGAGRFTEAVALMLHRHDANWGHLLKPSSRTHVVGPDGRRHAVDVILYRTNGQIVDIIRDAGEPGAGLTWGAGREGEYGESDWYAPAGVSPEPQPVPNVDLAAVLSAINELRLDFIDGMAKLELAVKQQPAPRPAVSYFAHVVSNISFPAWLGGTRTLTQDFDLTPKQ
jgi:hypothetical protein